MCGYVPFWVEADSFADWDWGDSLPFELKQIRLLIECVGMRSLISWYSFVSEMSMWRCVSFWLEANTFTVLDWGIAYLLSWYSFVCWLSMWGCVPFWLEADSFADWVCGNALTFEWNRLVCWLSMRGCVNFWVEASSFADWVCGDVFPFKLIQFRLLIEYVGMR